MAEFKRQSCSGGTVSTNQTTPTTIFDINMNDRSELTFKIVPAVRAFTVATLEVLIADKDTAWVTWLTSAADWQNPAGIVRGSSGHDLNVLAVGTTADYQLDLPACARVRLRATGTTDATGTATFSWNVR